MVFEGHRSVSRVRILLLAKYGRMGASTRLRSLQYLPAFQRAGVEVVTQSLLSDAALLSRYQQGFYRVTTVLKAYSERTLALLGRRNFSLLWIEKESLPWWPLWIERLLLRGVPYVLDYDDADFHYYDEHRWEWVRQIFGRRLDGLMAEAALVIAGNDYLARRARDAGARWVEVVPTVIDLLRYPFTARYYDPHNGLPRIVWIGSPCTAHYLDALREPLGRLASQIPFVLRVIGSGTFEMAGVQVEVVSWNEDTEAQCIHECDVGVMPLLDGPFEKGKCGYKLIQYMGCGLPVVASKVGANMEIVQEGVTGFLVRTPDEWHESLAKLLDDRALRSQMGAAGRLQVEKHFCLQQTGPQLVNLLCNAAQA
ncbi:MAG: glycosyltransferase family 4 protein [Burkholderiales bacterium]|nr:glycosyltransferase family 4 protein [Burkholderiales bacterium]MBK7313079.1 glycosyltransferase family 4 protein [Burkholderiales bacterium]